LYWIVLIFNNLVNFYSHLPKPKDIKILVQTIFLFVIFATILIGSEGSTHSFCLFVLVLACFVFRFVFRFL